MCYGFVCCVCLFVFVDVRVVCPLILKNIGVVGVFVVFVCFM